MGYEVLVDGATVQHVTGTTTDADGKVAGEMIASQIHRAGDVIPEDELPQHLKDAVKDGDEHVSSLLKKVSAKSEKTADEDEDKK